MKIKSVFIAVAFFLAGGFFSCQEENVNFYEAPEWAMESGDYSESMTGVIDLPEYVKPYVSEGDELAAFIGDVCRGTGTLIDGVFFINIQGNPEEASPIVFRYYNSRNRYLYQESGKIFFEPNGIIGTADLPYVLTLEVL